MTIRGRIIAFLEEHPEGIDDDALAEALQLKHRQQANSRCRQLAKDGLVERRRMARKIHNFWLGAGEAGPDDISQAELRHAVSGSTPWFWEGNVQGAVVQYLAERDSIIQSVADTASRQRGKDIVAERNGKRLWITVKGYPRGTERTPPSTQAGHWFKQAVFDIIEYRGESIVAQLGMALPDFPRYRSLAAKTEWFRPVAGFTYYWVQRSGRVVLE